MSNLFISFDDEILYCAPLNILSSAYHILSPKTRGQRVREPLGATSFGRGSMLFANFTTFIGRALRVKNI